MKSYINACTRTCTCTYSRRLTFVFHQNLSPQNTGKPLPFWLDQQWVQRQSIRPGTGPSLADPGADVQSAGPPSVGHSGNLHHQTLPGTWSINIRSKYSLQVHVYCKCIINRTGHFLFHIHVYTNYSKIHKIRTNFSTNRRTVSINSYTYCFFLYKQ